MVPMALIPLAAVGAGKRWKTLWHDKWRGKQRSGYYFFLRSSASTFTKLKDFDSTNGAYPAGSLMQASDGKLYGMTTSGGSSNLGVVFSFDPSTGTFTKLQNFNGTNGAHPFLGAAFIEVSPTTALPVTFLSFDGELINEQAVLHWSTADEINNEGYEVERSENGINFLKIGFVPAKGNAASVVHYSFTDINFKKPVRFYRLKQLDINGHFTYSSVIQINASNANSYRVNIAPNPSSNVTTISFSLPQSGKISLKIVDQFGRLITVLASGDMQAGKHEIKWELNMPDSRPVPAGIYFLRMETENYSETKKISVIK